MVTRARSKKNKRPVKQIKQKNSLFYIVGILACLTVLFIVLMEKEPSSQKAQTLVEQYLHRKYSVAQMLGKIHKMDFEKIDRQQNPSQANQTKYNVQVKIKAQKGEAILTTEVIEKQEELFLQNIQLLFGNKKYPLSPLYVEKLVLRTTLKGPVIQASKFFEGEDVHLSYVLKGFPPQQKIDIVQALQIFKKEKNNYQLNKNLEFPFLIDEQKKQIIIKNHIQSLEAGDYLFKSIFRDKTGVFTEINEQKITVIAIKDPLTLKNISYFADANFQKKKADASYTSDQKIYLRFILEGFVPEKSRLAGSIDVDVKDSLENVVLSKKAFVQFKKDFQPNKETILQSSLALEEPGIYFLHFTIRDLFSTQKIEHTEKVIIQFPAR